MNRSDQVRAWKLLQCFLHQARNVSTSRNEEETFSELKEFWKETVQNLVDSPDSPNAMFFPYGGNFSLTLGRKKIFSKSPWQKVCEDIDSDRFYLEYSRFYDRGIRVDRQFLLVPSEKIALFVDSVLSLNDPLSRLNYSGSFHVKVQYEVEEDPLARELAFVPIQKSSPLLPLRLIPLALPEWKKDSSYGEFTLDREPTEVLFSCQGTGALCFPILVDYHPRRWNTPKMTWRRLTVAREFEKVPDSEAVGFRYQGDNDQYLFYRSLGEDLLRSVLGEHLRHQTLFARFAPYGKTRRILEVDELSE